MQNVTALNVSNLLIHRVEYGWCIAHKKRGDDKVSQCGSIDWFAEAQLAELDKTEMWPFTELEFQSESSLPAIPSSPLPKLRLGPPIQLL